jgi:hypothetical protein
VVRRVGAAVLVGMMLLSGAVTAGLVYRCPMDGGMTQQHCCCPPAETDVETPTIARGCCLAEDVDTAAPAPSETSRPQLAPIAPVALRLPAAPVLAPTRAPETIVDAPATGPPLILQKQSFLI